MRRRFPAALLLVGLLLGSTVTPAAATDPVASEPPASPVPSVEPSGSPSAQPSPSPSEAIPVEPAPEPQQDPSPSAGASPASDPAPPAKSAAPVAPRVDAAGRPDPSGRFIVVLKDGSDTQAVVARLHKRAGVEAIRSFGRAFRGFSARLDATQKRDLLADPKVAMVVPDEVIELAAQTTPTGISRIGTKSSSLAKINGIDERVNADIAIVDTGIAAHPDLNIGGGYNCSTSDRSLWRDKHGHGTHVAGTIAAKDNTSGVVGVAPGARVWAVKILNDNGYGLLSWYVCGLDWILAQRDPGNSSQPLFESVNMSVAKSGADDGACGTKNSDILHKAICRVVGGGITVVAAAANDSASATHRVPAAYNEVITVSALADTDGKSGGLGGNRCYSWGSYDKDDTFANFSNYGYDVDLIAPGKCIWSTIGTSSYGYMSGTSMAAPHVAGAVALFKASRPLATPSQVKGYLQYLGNLNWRTSTDPDSHHEKLLSVAKIGNLGTFGFATSPTGGPIGESGGSDSIAVTLTRSSSFFERVSFSISEVPAGWSASLASPSLMGWSANTTSLKVTVPAGTRHGTYRIRVTGINWGRSASVLVPVVVENDNPTMSAPTVVPLSGSAVTVSSVTPTALAVKVSWTAASDASSDIAGYQVQHSVDGGTWGGTRSFGPATRSTTWSGITFGPTHSFRIRAQDEAGNWSAWQQLGSGVRYSAVSDRSSSIAYSASWERVSSSTATNGVRTSSSHGGAIARYTFTARGISVIAPRSPNRGKVAIYVDGVLRATVDTRADSVQARRIVYSQKWSSSSSHTIKLVVAGTAGRPTVSLDGFVLTR